MKCYQNIRRIKEINAFMEHIVELAKSDENIRDQAIELINSYGRRNIDDLRPYYEKLSKMV